MRSGRAWTIHLSKHSPHQWCMGPALKHSLQVQTLKKACSPATFSYTPPRATTTATNVAAPLLFMAKETSVFDGNTPLCGSLVGTWGSQILPIVPNLCILHLHVLCTPMIQQHHANRMGCTKLWIIMNWLNTWCSQVSTISCNHHGHGSSSVGPNPCGNCWQAANLKLAVKPTNGMGPVIVSN